MLRNPGSECQIAISSREMAASFRHFIRYRKMWNSDLRTSQYSTFSFFNCPVEHISNSYYDRSLESLNVCSFLDIIDERYLPFLVKCTVVNFYSTSEIFSADAININEGYAKGVSRELIISFVCIVENSLFVMNESMESSIKLCFSNYSVHRIASNDIIILTTTNFVHLKFESLKDMEYVMLSVQNELEQTIEIDPNLNIQLHLMRNIIQDCCNELDSDSGFSSSDHKSCSLFVGNIYLPMISMNMWFSLFSYCCHMDKLLPKAILSLHYSSFLLCIQKRNFLLGKSCNNKLVYAMLNNGSLVFFHCSSNGTIDLESYDECSLKFAVCSRSLDCSMFEFTIASIDGVWTFRCGSSIEVCMLNSNFNLI